MLMLSSPHPSPVILSCLAFRVSFPAVQCQRQVAAHGQQEEANGSGNRCQGGDSSRHSWHFPGTLGVGRGRRRNRNEKRGVNLKTPERAAIAEPLIPVAPLPMVEIRG